MVISFTRGEGILWCEILLKRGCLPGLGSAAKGTGQTVDRFETTVTMDGSLTSPAIGGPFNDELDLIQVKATSQSQGDTDLKPILGIKGGLNGGQRPAVQPKRLPIIRSWFPHEIRIQCGGDFGKLGRMD